MVWKEKKEATILWTHHPMKILTMGGAFVSGVLPMGV
jgi:hypothetical protein